MSDVVEGEGIVGAIFVADFVDGVRASRSGVEAVGAVEDPAGVVGDALIGVDDTGRDDDALHVGLADDGDLFLTACGGVRPGIPEVKLEIAGSHEGEVVGLLDVLMRSAGDAR